jgi:uncharacterized integral membrane protein
MSMRRDDARDDSDRSGPTRRALRLSAKGWATLALIAILATFAGLNTEKIDVDFIFGSARAPVIVVIVVSAILGAAISLLASRWSRRRRS